MPVEVILPVLGETMDEGSIVKWFAEVGDRVQKGEPLYQVETDKAALDVEAPADGILRRIIHGQGEKVKVLTVVGLIGSPDEDIGAEEPGKLAETEPERQPPAPLSVQETGEEQARRDQVFASPRARKLAAVRGIDLSRVVGSGPNGRIVEKDVLAFVATQPAMTPLARKMAADAGIDALQLGATAEGRRIRKADVEISLAKASAPPQKQEPTQPAAEPEVQAMTGLRAIIAQRMGVSAQTTARVTLTTEADAAELVRLRALLRLDLESALGFVPSYNDILVAVASRALREHPYMNVRLVDDGIRLLPQINVGVAVDTDRGLLVPVIREADRKGIADIARTLRELFARARNGKSTPDDLTGGTFTITNLGMFDIDAFTPIINLPECAILGVGRVQECPVVRAGQVCVGQVMALSLTFDHRVVDGAPAARFLQRIKHLVETPGLLLA